MITRYSRPEMRAIWTDENKLKIWLQIELLASEALVKEGVVPAKDFKKIKAGCDKWFADLPLHFFEALIAGFYLCCLYSICRIPLLFLDYC